MELIVRRTQQRDTFVSVTIKGLSLWHSDRAFTLDLVPVSDISKANEISGMIISTRIDAAAETKGAHP